MNFISQPAKDKTKDSLTVIRQTHGFELRFLPVKHRIKDADTPPNSSGFGAYFLHTWLKENGRALALLHKFANTSLRGHLVN